MERVNFDIFRSNVCHMVKDMGELDFIRWVICGKQVQSAYEKGWFAECLYLVAMTDYLSNKNDIPLYGSYNKLRACKLDKIIYPSSIVMMYLVSNDETILKESYDNSIPEFKRFNIVENEVEAVA